MSDQKPIITSEELDPINPLRQPLPWAVVLVCLLVFLAIKYSGEDESSNTVISENKEFPQIFLTNVEMRQFDKTGGLHYQLNTPLVRHFQAGKRASDADYTLINTPTIIMSSKPDAAPWYINAKEGRSENNGLWLTLSPEVVAQSNSPKLGDITINTYEMRVNTQDQFAETNKAVTMRSARSRVDAQGLHADIKRERIELLSHVKGTYEP